MRKISAFCDYFVICSGKSHRMVKSLSGNIKQQLSKEKITPEHIEGGKIQEPSWILMDYGDVLVHVFDEEARPFYNLEWLWSDAAKLDLNFI